jgi:TolB-like protein/Tfp pilus assembly protein PilF
LKKEKDVDRSQSITHATGRKLDFAIIAVLVLALGYFAYDKFLLRPEAVGLRADAGRSIAVLPFVNMSDDAGNEYFSDGISEELLNALAKVKDLQVAGRTSSFAFKGRNEDLRTIGAALGVSHILEGSVRKAGVQVRITAQLIQVEDGFHLWSDTYDRELTDIFAIQDEIAQAILDQLKVHLIGEGGEIPLTSARADVSAFDLYLEAKQKIYLRRREPLEEAAELLNRAIAIDPDYAPAFAQRGITFMLLREAQYGTIPTAEAHKQAKIMFDQALSLDPASAEAWAGQGLYFYDTGELEQAIDALQKALVINPNLVNASLWLSTAHARLGNLREATRIREDILVRDPLYLPAIANVLDDYTLYGDLEKSQALMNRIRAYMPASRTMVSWDGVLLFVSGRLADSLPYFESAYEMEPENANSIGQLSRALMYSWQYERLTEMPLNEFRVVALTRLNRIDEASKVAWDLADSDHYVFPLAGLLVHQGEYAELIEFVESRWPDLQAFEAAYPERDGWSENCYLGLIAFSYQRLGNVQKFDEAMSRFKAALDYQRNNGANNHWFAFAEAVYAVLAGDHDTALSRLARSFEGGANPGPQLSKFWPMFEPLQDDPRYESVVKNMEDHVNSERVKLGLEPVG